MTQLPPTGGDGAPDESQNPHAPVPPSTPGGYPPAPPPPGAMPPPPGAMPPPGTPPPLPAGGWPGAAPGVPPGGSPYGSPYAGGGGYVPPPYGAPGFGTPGYGGFGVPGSVPFASYGARLGGWLIDWLILFVVGIVVTIPLHLLHKTYVQVNGVRATHYHLGLGGILFDAAIVIVYGGLMCGSGRGQTVGMMATGTRAVGADTGTVIGYGRAFGRAAFEYLMAFLFVIPWIVDMLFPLWDPRNQTLHDKVTNTVVIKI